MWIFWCVVAVVVAATIFTFFPTPNPHLLLSRSRLKHKLSFHYAYSDGFDVCMFYNVKQNFNTFNSMGKTYTFGSRCTDIY